MTPAELEAIGRLVTGSERRWRDPFGLLMGYKGRQPGQPIYQAMRKGVIHDDMAGRALVAARIALREDQQRLDHLAALVQQITKQS